MEGVYLKLCVGFRTRKASVTARTHYLQSWVSRSQQCPPSVAGGPDTGVCGKMLSPVLSTQTDPSRMLVLGMRSVGGRGVVLSLGESSYTSLSGYQVEINFYMGMSLIHSTDFLELRNSGF